MDPSCKLEEEEARSAILQRLFHLLGTTYYQKRNPVSLPKSLQRKDFDELLQNDYMVSEKPDGTRFILFLLEALGGHYSVMIDRKLDVYQLPVAASRGYFRGSVFDGELVNTPTADVFLIFDCLCLKGSLLEENYCSRLTKIRECFDLGGLQVSNPEEAAAQAKLGKVICGGSRRGLQFRAKQCFQLRQLDTLLRRLSGLSYRCDGLVFTPVHKKLSFGRSDCLYKYKTTHTIDVEVSPDGESIWVGCEGGPAQAGLRMDVLTLDQPLQVDASVTSKAKECAGKIVELTVALSEAGFRLSFKGVRVDKTHPNVRTTVLSTLESVKEEITTTDLLELSKEAALYQDKRSSIL
jgi:hypothetical protein